MGNPSVAVIIPTIGKDTLWKCVQSVMDQTYDNVEIHVVCDGGINYSRVMERILHPSRLTVMIIPENVGAKGFYGHRIYAAMSFLCNQDYMVFLDEDNWLEPNHIESLIATIQSKNLDWAYSLRNICQPDGKLLFKDQCESLGKWAVWTGMPGSTNEETHHVDTSCYCVKTDIMTKIGNAWYGKYGQDRRFYQNLSHYFPNYHTSGKHTMNYRLGGNEYSLSPEYIRQGNKFMEQHYFGTTGHGRFPWEN